MECRQCGHAAEQAFTYCPACGTPAAGDGTGSLAGRTVNGKYRVLESLGAGSMGSVYLAEHIALRKRIALKVLHRELQLGDEAVQRFQREGIAAGQINHPNVIQIFDFDRTPDGICFLAMEFVEGESLRELLARKEALPPDLAIGLVHELLQTLAVAHGQGVVHRDLKPENIMVLGADTGEPTLKVLDFGLSKLVDRRADASLQTMSGRVMGTPLYMAPEQWHGGEVDARADLYAAAVILFELVTGQQPFKAENITETLMRSTTEDPPSVLDHETRFPVPLDLDDVLNRGLAKDPDDRFQDADEMLDALDGVRLERVRRQAQARRPAGARRRAGGVRKAGAPGKSGTMRRGGAAAARAGRRAKASGRRRRPEPEPKGRRGLVLGGALGGGALLIAVLLVWGLGGNADGDGGGAPRLVQEIPAGERTEAQRDYVESLREVHDRLRAGEIAKAMAAAERAMRSEVADAAAWLERARVYDRQRDSAAARLDYQEAVDRLPGFGEAIAGLGWLDLREGDAAAAEQRFREAMAADPDCGAAHAGAAAVLLADGDPQAALELIDKASETARRDPLALAVRGEALLELDRVPDARTAFTQAKRADSSLWRSYRGLALAAEREGDLGAAMQQCVAGLAMVPDNQPLRLIQAELLIAEGRPAEAGAVLTEVVTQDGRYHLLRGLALEGQGEADAALAAWGEALAAGVERPGKVHLLVAMAHARTSGWEECAAAAEQALAADANLGRAAFYRGLAAFRLERYEAAAGHIQRAVDLDGSDLLARYTLGVLYMDYLAQPEAARAQLEAYRDLGGDDPKVAGWLEKLGR